MGEIVAALAGYACAAGTTSITPRESVPLAGYQDRVEGFRGVSDGLEANALLLTFGLERVLFVSLDLLFVGADLTSAVERRAAYFGLTRAQVVVAASHSHFAPATDRGKPSLGRVDEDYLRTVESRVVELVSGVLRSPLRPIELRHSQVDAPYNVNRRRRWLGPTVTRAGIRLGPTMVMAPARDGARDTALEALYAIGEDGGIVAVLWKYACHPVSCPERLLVTAEYPGHARRKLRRELERDIPIVFWQGFSGDVRPWIGGARSFRDRVRALRIGPAFGSASASEWLAWMDGVAAALIVAITQGQSMLIAGPLAVAAREVPMSEVFDTSLNPQLPANVRLARVNLGPRLSALFVSAEVCSPYLESISGDVHTICVGCVGDVFGYLPGMRQLPEGGYEVDGFLAPFGIKGAWRPGGIAALAEVVSRWEL